MIEMPTNPIKARSAGRGSPHPPAAVILTVVVVLVAAFMDLLDATIVSVAAPTIAAALDATGTQLQWVVAAYVLALGASLVTGGRIGDQIGRRRVFLLGLAGFALASAACALAPAPEVLIATRVIQGLAAGLMIPQVFGVFRASLEPAARDKALGAYGAVLGLASVAGPLLGGLLVDADLFGLGWRTIFWVNVPVAAIGFVLGWTYLPESKEAAAARLDLVGAVLAASAVVALLIPLVQSQLWGWTGRSTTLVVVAIGCAAAFVGWERRVVRRGGQPVLDPALLRVRSFAAGLAASVLFFGAIGPFFLLLMLFLQLGTGRSAWASALVILPYALGSIVTSGLGIRLAVRLGRTLLIIGALVLALSQALLWMIITITPAASAWLLAIPLLVGGLGLGLAAPPLVGVVLAGVPARDAGAASGVLTTVSQIGNAIGIAVLGLGFFTALGSARPRSSDLDRYAGAFTAILPWQVGCYLAAAALMLLLPRGTRPVPAT